MELRQVIKINNQVFTVEEYFPMEDARLAVINLPERIECIEESPIKMGDLTNTGEVVVTVDGFIDSVILGIETIAIQLKKKRQ